MSEYMKQVSWNLQSPLSTGGIRYARASVVGISGTEVTMSDGTVGTILSLSKEGKEKARNHSETVKESGVTSARELSEIQALETREMSRRSANGQYMADDEMEAMRLTDNERYQKIKVLRAAAAADALVHRTARIIHGEEDAGDDGTWGKLYLQGVYTGQREEYLDDVDRKTAAQIRKQYAQYCIWETADDSPEAKALHDKLTQEADELLSEWEQQNLDEDGVFQNPASRQFTALDVLGKAYSDSTHDTTFNFYGEKDDPLPDCSIYHVQVCGGIRRNSA